MKRTERIVGFQSREDVVRYSIVNSTIIKGEKLRVGKGIEDKRKTGSAGHSSRLKYAKQK